MNTKTIPGEIATFIEALMKAGADPYEVGGPVRDRLIGKELKDHDILCRNLGVKEIVAVLKPFGKVTTVGRSFGVIKFSPRKSPELEMDIALPRKETSTGTGHKDFDVDFDPKLPVEDDLGRRDFTINAMAMSFADGRIIDPFDGAKDLKNKTLRMVFDRAFEEDPLRLVRGIQFAARMKLTIEEKTWDAMKRSAHLIKTVSPERISMELIKLMSAEKPSIGFDLMFDCGLMQYIIPELAAVKGIEQDKRPGDDVYQHTMRVLDAARSDAHIEHVGDLDLLFSALLHDLGKSKTARNHPSEEKTVFFGHQIVSARMARKWMKRMKLDSCGIDIASVIMLIQNHMFDTKSYFTDRAIRRFIAKLGTDLIFKLTDLRLSDNRGGKHPNGIKGVLKLKKRITEEMAKKPPFGAKDLTINGHDLINLGIPEGPALGRILQALVECVLDEPKENDRDKLLALAKEMLENPSLIDTHLAKGEERHGESDGSETTKSR